MNAGEFDSYVIEPAKCVLILGVIFIGLLIANILDKIYKILRKGN